MLINMKSEYWPKALELFGRFGERVKFDRPVPRVLHKRLEDGIEKSVQEIAGAVKQLDLQMSETLKGLGD